VLHGRTSAFCCAVVCLLAGSASGTPPATLSIRTSSECPRAVDVARELGPILPATAIRVAAEARAAEGASATVDDLGEEVSIRVAGEERIIHDTARACTERARSAAVFIGLVLDPPVLPGPRNPEPAPAKVVVARPRPPHGSERSARLSIELGPLVYAALGSAREVPAALGLGGRVVWGNILGVSFGIAGSFPATFHLAAADARISTLSSDIAFRGTAYFDPLRLSGEIGPELALLFVEGVNVDNARSSIRADVGIRGAITGAWMVSRRIRAFVGLHAAFFPRQYDLDLNPSGHAGRTPPWWIGGALGIAFDVTGDLH
jgi:hypothetical protein